MVDLVGTTKFYRGSYVATKGRKFVVICGNVTQHSVTAFINDFLAHGRREVASEIVFLGENAPSLEMETIFRCYSAYTRFFMGSVLKTEDLLRVQMDKAQACLILANTCSSNPDTEDTCNIMRVLSIKNNFPNLRVIIQIIQSSNKVFLPKIPGWDWKKGDSIICFAELKLGLIAYSCLVPGLTTLLTSLFISEDYKDQNILLKYQHEIEGKDYKVMTHLLSNDFVGMPFKQVCRLCFMKLNLILLGIEFRSGVQGNSILINPLTVENLLINTMGFFIARSVKELKRAGYYCKKCHSEITNPELIVKCRCKLKGMRINFSVSGRKSIRHEEVKFSPAPKSPTQSIDSFSDKRRYPGSDKENVSHISLDATGMFHWCEAVPFENAILKRKKKSSIELHDHILVCVFGDATSELIELRNFVMPLRASNFAFSELKDIVFVGSLEYLQREWKFIHTFPKLYIQMGSALSCADLRAAGIKYCSMCAVLSANTGDAGNQSLVDTKSILATLNIRYLQFKLNATPVTYASSEDVTESQERFFAKRIPVITELKIASNSKFLEHCVVDRFDTTDQNFSYQMSRGSLFSDSFLDSLLCTTYHNYRVLALLQTLVTGGTSPEVEDYLAERISMIGSSADMVHLQSRNRCILALLPLIDNPHTIDGLLLYFGDVYTKALDKCGIICFGIYRLKATPNPNGIRFVIARPPTNFEVLFSDQFFCLIPYGILVKDLTDVVNSFPPKSRRTAFQKEEEKNVSAIKSFFL